MPATTTFLPTRESELVTWSLTFKTLITATPTAYALTAGQATTYGGLHDTFVTKYNLCNADATRSPSNIVAKDDAKIALIANARLLARIVQAAPSVTNQQKSDLGLTVRDVGPTPIPPPSDAPDIDIVAVSGNTVRLRLHEAGQSSKRAKPDGVAGATIFSAVGAVAPTTEEAWTFQGNTTKTLFDVTFPPTIEPGAKVWFTAFWRNNRDESGPASTPVTTNIAGGSAMAA
jgi:hypothetical protein